MTFDLDPSKPNRVDELVSVFASCYRVYTMLSASERRFVRDFISKMFF